MNILYIGNFKDKFIKAIDEITQIDIANSSVVILYVTNLLLSNPCLKEVLSWLVNRKGKHFRCYVFPQDQSPKDFMNWLDTDEAKYWEDFKDVYHLSEARIATDEQLKESLLNLPQELKNEKLYNFYMFSLAIVQLVLGKICFLIQLSSIVVFTFGCLYLHKPKNLTNISPNFVEFENWPLFLILLMHFGMATLIVLDFNPFFLLFRHGEKNVSNQTKKYTVNSFILLISMSIPIFILVLSYYSGKMNELWSSSIFLFILTGIIVDSFRRLQYSAKKFFISKNISKDNYTKDYTKLNKLINKSRADNLFLAFKLPYRLKDVPNVFISYTHSSKRWTHHEIKNIATTIVKYKGNIFVDQINICLGSNWREALHNRITEATHIICLVDSISVTKAYCAVELETAIRLRGETNTPNIYIIASNELDINKIPEAKPIFKELFKYEFDYRPPVQIIREGLEIPSVFWISFCHPDVTDSILPEKLQNIIGFCSRRLSYFFMFLIYFSSLVVIFKIIGKYLFVVFPSESSVNSSLINVFKNIVLNTYHWLFYLISFLLAFNFLSLWNDLFRIYKLKKNTNILDYPLRLFFLIYGISLFWLNVPNLTLYEILSLVFCAFVGISLSEDTVVLKVTLFKTHKIKSESLESLDIKYINWGNEHVELNTRCFNFLHSLGDTYNFKNIGEFGCKIDDLSLKTDCDKLSKLIKLTSEDGGLWILGDLFIIFGIMEYQLGHAKSSALSFQKAIQFITFNNYRYTFDDQMLLLYLELYAAKALAESSDILDKDKSQVMYRALSNKCYSQIVIASKRIKPLSDDDDSNIATIWKLNAEDMLKKIQIENGKTE